MNPTQSEGSISKTNGEAPWLSVVTVVRNDKQGLYSTIKSLSQQELAGVQFVVIDSSEQRNEVPEIMSHFQKINCEYTWVPPQGIYSAMNAGLNLSQGEYILFANAGDDFYAPSTIKQLRDSVEKSRATWIVGRVCIVSRSGGQVLTPILNYKREKKSLFARGKFPPHQATLARTNLLKSLGGFSLQYPIAADYHVALQMSTIEPPLILDQVLMIFREGGTSTDNWQQSFKEFHQARCQVFQPEGIEQMRELRDTYLHFAKVWIYRKVLSPNSSLPVKGVTQ